MEIKMQKLRSLFFISFVMALLLIAIIPSSVGAISEKALEKGKGKALEFGEINDVGEAEETDEEEITDEIKSISEEDVPEEVEITNNIEEAGAEAVKAVEKPEIKKLLIALPRPLFIGVGFVKSGDGEKAEPIRISVTSGGRIRPLEIKKIVARTKNKQELREKILELANKTKRKVSGRLVIGIGHEQRHYWLRIKEKSEDKKRIVFWVIPLPAHKEDVIAYKEMSEEELNTKVGTLTVEREIFPTIEIWENAKLYLPTGKYAGEWSLTASSLKPKSLVAEKMRIVAEKHPKAVEKLKTKRPHLFQRIKEFFQKFRFRRAKPRFVREAETNKTE